MHQIKIPILPISEKTTWGELPETLEVVISLLEEKDPENVSPIVIFEPLEEPNRPDRQVTVSDAPEELFVVALGPEPSQAVFEALSRVEAREPEYPKGQPVRKIKIKDNTPLKSFYRQMADLPITVYSATFSGVDFDSLTLFFIRTPFTANEFMRELQKPIE